MTIGVKYCGGCNPRYERGEEMRKLKERYPSVHFERYQEQKTFDKVLLICGCERVCLEFRPELAGENVVVVSSPQELMELELE